jgi:hypothetical protein
MSIWMHGRPLMITIRMIIAAAKSSDLVSRLASIEAAGIITQWAAVYMTEAIFLKILINKIRFFFPIANTNTLIFRKSHFSPELC